MEWWTHIVSFLAGIGAGWTLKIVVSSSSLKSKRTKIISQKGNTVHGDMVAGDMSKKNSG